MAASSAAALTRLECRCLGVVAGGREIVRQLELSLEPGQLLAVLGRNGTGKTLTLLTLAGLRGPGSGQVLLEGRPMADWPARQRARHIGMLLQDPGETFPATVFESVLGGRYAHLGLAGQETEADRAAALRAMEVMQLADLADRQVSSLSGGERQRLSIATVIAQDTPVSILDEPVNALDPGHQVAVMEFFRERTRQGCAVIASLHDPTLAARYADTVLMLDGAGGWSLDDSATALNEAALSRLYRHPIREVRDDCRRVFVAD